MFNSVRLVGAAALMFLFGGAALADGPVAVGKEFPNLQLQNFVTSKSFELKELRGKVVLIDFWATWCGPCRAELPNLKRVYEKYQADGFEVLAISLDQDLSKLTQFLKSNALPWLHVNDPDGKIADKFGVVSIPMTYLLDKDGRVTATNLRGRKLEPAVVTALKGPEAAKQLGEQANEAAAKELLNAADARRDSRQYALALEQYEKLVEKFPQTAAGIAAKERIAALRADADIAELLGKQQDELKAQRSKIIELPPADARKADRWLRLAAELLKQNEVKQARTRYEQLISQYPNSPQAKIAREELAKLKPE